jgi:hypothetical protein
MLGQDLFGKGFEANLNPSALKKAKKKGKGKLVDIIADNLNDLVEFYFGEFTKHDVRQRYEKVLLKLLGSNPYFIKPLGKLIKKAKKKDSDIEIPKGLHVLLMDNLDEVRILYQKEKNKLKNAAGGENAMSEDIRNRINTIDALSEVLIATTTDICDKLIAKQVKKIEKIGLDEDSATVLARTWVPAKYLTPRNVRRYMFRTNSALYRIQFAGMIKTDDDDHYQNHIGVNLSDPDIIKEIYEFMLAGVSHKVLMSALVGIMLERRGMAFERFTKPQLALYNTITALILDILEGNEIINVTGEKVKGKKAKKELEISKKDLKNFMREYSDERARDSMKGRDGHRRISFSNLAEDSYPKVLKAFKACNKDYFDSIFDEEPQKDKNNNNDRHNDKNRDNRDRDRRDDRNNNDRNRNRDRRDDRRDRDKRRYDDNDD